MGVPTYKGNQESDVADWSREFDRNNPQLNSVVVSITVPNTTTVEIPHTLNRPYVGGVVEMGTLANRVAIVIPPDSAAEEGTVITKYVLVKFSAANTGTYYVRVW